MIWTAILLSLLPMQAPKEDAAVVAEKMLALATADQPLTTTGVVNAPVKDVWEAWTTTDGIKKWMVASGEVVFRIGGHLKTSYSKNSDLNGPDVIVNTILAYDPQRMITIKNTQAPANFPFKKAMENVWTVIYLEPVGEKQTKVTVRMLGYDHSSESQKMKGFFKMGNQSTMDALVKRFSTAGQ